MLDDSSMGLIPESPGDPRILIADKKAVVSGIEARKGTRV